MTKVKKSRKTKVVRRTYNTTSKVDKALLAAAEAQERSAAFIINTALKNHLGITDARS